MAQRLSVRLGDRPGSQAADDRRCDPRDSAVSEPRHIQQPAVRHWPVGELAASSSSADLVNHGPFRCVGPVGEPTPHESGAPSGFETTNKGLAGLCRGAGQMRGQAVRHRAGRPSHLRKRGIAGRPHPRPSCARKSHVALADRTAPRAHRASLAVRNIGENGPACMLSVHSARTPCNLTVIDWSIRVVPPGSSRAQHCYKAAAHDGLTPFPQPGTTRNSPVQQTKGCSRTDESTNIQPAPIPQGIRKSSAV